MKKILLIAAVAGMAMVSCKKDYTCECTVSTKIYDDGKVTGTTNGTTSGPTGKMKKKDAEDGCTKNNGTTIAGNTTDGVESTIDCKIK